MMRSRTSVREFIMLRSRVRRCASRLGAHSREGSPRVPAERRPARFPRRLSRFEKAPSLALIEAPRLSTVAAYRHVAPLARAAAAFVQEEPVTVVGSTDSHPVELFRREKLYRRAKDRSEHPVESLRVLFPRELVARARAENGASIGCWKRLPEGLERGWSTAGEDGEKRLPEPPRAGEHLP